MSRNLKTAWFHSVPNKSVIKCTSLKNRSSVRPCERFHFSKSLLTEEESVRHLSTSVFWLFFLGFWIPCCGWICFVQMQTLLVDDPRANNRSEVFTPLLYHAPCYKKTDCCRAALSQLHSSYKENKGTVTLDTGATWSLISWHWILNPWARLNRLMHVLNNIHVRSFWWPSG